MGKISIIFSVHYLIYLFNLITHRADGARPGQPLLAADRTRRQDQRRGTPTRPGLHPPPVRPAVHHHAGRQRTDVQPVLPAQLGLRLPVRPDGRRPRPLRLSAQHGLGRGRRRLRQRSFPSAANTQVLLRK